MVAAYAGWADAFCNKGASSARDFARRHFLSSTTLQMLSDMRAQFAAMMAEIGFLEGSGPSRRKATGQGSCWVTATPDAPSPPPVSTGHGLAPIGESWQYVETLHPVFLVPDLSIAHIFKGPVDRGSIPHRQTTPGHHGTVTATVLPSSRLRSPLHCTRMLP